ncbi:MAG: hypothetical protein OXC29_15665, partial [Rhodococcus sp.]|nr:hypothetical protein [Rhodococcus sp. (in: high G+C Gram-positive bacteria)]
VNVASPVERGTPPAVARTTEIGERTLGPIRLQGRVEVREEGSGRAEYWVHDPPLMETAADPLAYPPIGQVVPETLDLNADNAITGTRRPHTYAPSPRTPRSQESSTEAGVGRAPASRLPSSLVAVNCCERTAPTGKTGPLTVVPGKGAAREHRASTCQETGSTSCR